MFFAMMASGGNLIVPRQLWVVLTVVSCLPILRWRVPICKSRSIIYIWVTLVIGIGLFLVGQGTETIASVLSRLTTFLAAILLLEVYLNRPLDRLMTDLFVILRLMTIQALLTAILGNLAGEYFPSFDVEGTQYYSLGLLFNFHHTVADAQFIRPNGFFYEPGVFQIYISIFLYLCVFWRVSVFWVIMAFIALVTIWSTVGLAVAVIMVSLGFKRLVASARGTSKWLIVFAFLCFIPVGVSIAYSNIIEKTVGEMRGSSIARQYDFLTGLNVIQTKPWTGIGFQTKTYLEYNELLGTMSTELPMEYALERPNTNGILNVFYTIGIPLGLLLLVGIWTQSLFTSRLPMAILLTGSFIGQAIVFSPFFLLILFSGLVLKLRRNGNLHGKQRT